MKKFHVYSSIDENFNKPQALQSAVNFGMIPLQSQKTIAEPANSTYLQLAHSTPEACFFMCNIRTPKEFADFVFIHQIYKIHFRKIFNTVYTFRINLFNFNHFIF